MVIAILHSVILEIEESVPSAPENIAEKTKLYDKTTATENDKRIP